MKFHFYKYHGTGNDFILIDNRSNDFPKSDIRFIEKICHRNFGIGADGLILLEQDSLLDFKMVYFNSDGVIGSMCGNGGRCIVHFAHFLGIISTEKETVFSAFDGEHRAKIDLMGNVELKMKDVLQIHNYGTYTFLNTGSPHHIEFHSNLSTMNVDAEGSAIRYNLYGEDGSNVNFVEELNPDHFLVRTYERGVEAETLSCGTGAVAVAVAVHYIGRTNKNEINIEYKGGNLKVTFKKVANGYSDIVLWGPVEKVFKGEIIW